MEGSIEKSPAGSRGKAPSTVWGLRPKKPEKTDARKEAKHSS